VEAKSVAGDRTVALGRMGGEGRIGVPRLLEALSEPAPALRRAAACALARISGRADQTLPLLIAALGGEDRSQRREATDALAALGPAAAPTAGALVDAVLALDRRTGPWPWDFTTQLEALVGAWIRPGAEAVPVVTERTALFCAGSRTTGCPGSEGGIIEVE